MERSDRERTPLKEWLADWRSGVLVAACVAGGLTLTFMVIGVVPSAPGEASPQQAGPVPAVTSSVIETSIPAAGADLVTDSSLASAVDTTAPPSAASASARLVAAQVVPATNAPTSATPSPSPAVAPAVVAPVPAEAPVATTTPAPVTATIAPAKTTVVPVRAAPTSAPAVATTPPTTEAARDEGLTYPSYQSAGSGSVVLQYDGSAIYVAAVNTRPDWVYDVEKNGPRSVEIKFFNVVTKRDVEFHASLEDGRIKVEN